MSKGSGRRPQQIDDEQAAANWARIFGKTDEPTNQGEQPEPKEQDNGK